MGEKHGDPWCKAARCSAGASSPAPADPAPARRQVPVQPVPGKCILVSGHDLKMLDSLLEACKVSLPACLSNRV